MNDTDIYLTAISCFSLSVYCTNITYQPTAPCKEKQQLKMTDDSCHVK